MMIVAALDLGFRLFANRKAVPVGEGVIVNSCVLPADLKFGELA
jgi:hypothetical protein